MTNETYNNQFTTIINGLANLTGSEKQISWANDIRKNFIFQNVELIEKKCMTYSNGVCDLTATREKINAVLNDEAINTIISMFNRPKDSKFWIDNRDLMWLEINKKLGAM